MLQLPAFLIPNAVPIEQWRFLVPDKALLT